MTTIDLIRHGEPDTLIHDDLLRPLTLKGTHQADEIALKLRTMTYTHVFSSPFERAISTVTPVANDHNLPIKINDLLIERKMPGWFNSPKEFTNYITHQWSDFNYAEVGGESLYQAQQRYISFIKNMGEEDFIAIGSHGTVMSVLYDLVFPGKGFNFWNNLSYGSVLRLEVNKGSYIHAYLI